MSRETDSIVSTLGARRVGHGARARVRLAVGGSPVDSPSSDPSGAEIGRARPARKCPAARKKTRFYFVTRLPFGECGVPRGVTQAGMPQGNNYQSSSSGSMSAIPNVRNIYL